MPAVLKLVQSATTVNFLNAAGLYVLDPGWAPRVARVRGGAAMPVEEVLSMEVIGTSHDNVAATVQGLAEMQRLAEEYGRDRMREYAVWFHAQLSGETGERRARVRRIGMEWLSEHYAGEMVGFRPELRVAIERDGAWESAASVEMPASAVSGAASSYDYTSVVDVVGDVPARIDKFTLYSPAAGSNIGRVWIGLRGSSKVPVSGFLDTWELEDPDATLGTDAARATDTTASPGGSGDTKVTVTPGTATWAKRLTIAAGDVISTINMAANLGDFLWLLRHKVSAATWEVQLRWGYEAMADDDFIRGPVKEVDNTAWDYEEMGTQGIPLRNLQVFRTTLVTGLPATAEASYAVQVWARRTSGSGTLDLDCLCPIPVDEGFLKVWDFDLDTTNAEYIHFAESPRGTMQVMNIGTASFEGFPPFEAHNFRLPVGDGRMVIVFARPTEAVFTDSLSIGASDRYYPRWLSLRGAE